MSRDAYFYYGLGSNQEALVICYHNHPTAKTAYNIEKIGAKKRNVLFPPPKEDKSPIEDNADLKNIQNAILPKLEEIIEKLGGIKAVASLTFVGDVNLCTAANEVLADFLIDNEMLNKFEQQGILVNRILESSNAHVIKQAIDVHSKSFPNSPIVLRTKRAASDPLDYIVSRTSASVEEIAEIRNDRLRQIEASLSSVSGEAATDDTLLEVDGDISEDFAAISEEVKEQAAILDAISKPVDNELSAIEKKLQHITLSQAPTNDIPNETDELRFK